MTHSENNEIRGMGDESLENQKLENEGCHVNDEIQSEELEHKEKAPKIEGDFLVLDPRPQSLAAMKKKLSEQPTLGIEVTISELAGKCSKGNIDPQHTAKQVASQKSFEAEMGNDPDLSSFAELNIKGLTAIEVVAHPDFSVLEENVRLATIRPDNDSFGAMAVIKLRQAGIELTPDIKERIERIAEGDREMTGEWESQSGLKFEDRDWEYAGLAKIISDFKTPVIDRVQCMADWLVVGDCENLTESVEQVQLEYAEAVVKTEIVTQGEGFVTVRSEHRGAIKIGYEYAPVVIAMNPNFSLNGGEPHLKYTIAQWNKGYINLDGVLLRLQEEESDIRRGTVGRHDYEPENNWGGSETIIGSPQGVDSELLLYQVEDRVRYGISDAGKGYETRCINTDKITCEMKDLKEIERDLSYLYVGKFDKVSEELNQELMAQGVKKMRIDAWDTGGDNDRRTGVVFLLDKELLDEHCSFQGLNVLGDSALIVEKGKVVRAVTFSDIVALEEMSPSGNILYGGQRTHRYLFLREIEERCKEARRKIANKNEKE